jgi:hypothetical protein
LAIEASSKNLRMLITKRVISAKAEREHKSAGGGQAGRHGS